jgi:fumarate reductase iron-sulfur subunit
VDDLEVLIWRGAGEGRLVPYRVPRAASQTVLDVVTWVQRRLDASLAYRFSCRVGMCGSCAMTVNGAPRWTCRTHVSRVARDGRLEIAPLRNLPVIRDLACDMAPFFDKMQRAHGRFVGRFVPGPPEGGGFARISPATPARRAADAAIECIGCGVCHAACDVVAWRPDYLGPAALNRAWTLVNDERDGGDGPRLVAVAGDAGCHACHSQGSCQTHCPKELNPTRSIAGLKRRTARAALRGGL